MNCGCYEDMTTTILCSVHEEVKDLVIQKKPDWQRVSHLVHLGYRKNNIGTLPMEVSKPC